MNGVVYSVKCPKCSAEATAQMRAVGTTGTYREAMIKLGAARIVCKACGFIDEVPREKSDSYELWYATSYKGHRLWARNRKHLTFLISWFSGEISKTDLRIGNRAMVETFPRWMILAKNRPGLLKSLNRMAAIDTNKTVRRGNARKPTFFRISSIKS
jgi:hypothetical protein